MRYNSFRPSFDRLDGRLLLSDSGAAPLLAPNQDTQVETSDTNVYSGSATGCFVLNGGSLGNPTTDGQSTGVYVVNSYTGGN